MFVKQRTRAIAMSSQDPHQASSQFDVEQLALMCKALGHPARLRLLLHLADYGACYFGNLTEVCRSPHRASRNM
jgi:hypothetical protein